MQISDWLAFAGPIICLIIILLTGLLLWFRKVDLQNKNGAPSLALEYQRQFNVKIRDPALGMLFLGVLCLGFSYYFYLQLGVKNARLRIGLETDDPDDAVASFVGNFGNDHPDPQNFFEKEVPRNLHDVDVTITETGYKIWHKTIYLDSMQPSYKVKLTKKLDEPPRNPALIVNPDVNLPPLQSETRK